MLRVVQKPSDNFLKHAGFRRHGRESAPVGVE
jgi:hypothetical protein